MQLDLITFVSVTYCYCNTVVIMHLRVKISSIVIRTEGAPQMLMRHQEISYRSKLRCQLKIRVSHLDCSPNSPKDAS